MAKLPTWSELMNQIATTMTADATLWQQFFLDAQAGTATVSQYFQDVALTAQSWMDVWATIIGAGGSPTPPTAFILGSPWPPTMPKSQTVRLEVPLVPANCPLTWSSPLVLLGGGANPNPITYTAAYVDASGAQVKVNASLSGGSPASGMHAGAIYTTGETLVAAVFVMVP